MLQLPIYTRPPGPHLNYWVDWSNVNKVSCSRKQQQFGVTGNRTFRLPGQCSSHLAMLTHTHMRTLTRACMYARLHVCVP